MKFEALPEIPQIWIDFLQRKLSFLPATHELSSLPKNLDALRRDVVHRGRLLQILANNRESDSLLNASGVKQFGQSEVFVVVTTLYSSLLGGSVSQILKCLTAVKVCEELCKQGISAVPVAWISTAPPLDFDRRTIRLLDNESRLQSIQLPQSETIAFSPGDPLHASHVPSFISQIEEMGQGKFDSEVLEILKQSFHSDSSFSSATAHLFAALMKEWNLIVLDAEAPSMESIMAEALAPLREQSKRIQSLLQKKTVELASAGYGEASSDPAIPPFLIQSFAMPVIACVIDPCEVYSYAKALLVWEEMDWPRPLVWPRCSATILDSRSRKILERYQLRVDQLYSGEESVVGKIEATLSNSVLKKLDHLKREVESRIADGIAIEASGNEFIKTAEKGRKKILYQLERLRDRFSTAENGKKQAMRRQIRRACNFLAPNCRVQELELSGIQIPLRYSRAGIRALYEKLDILKFEHQLIQMD